MSVTTPTVPSAGEATHLSFADLGTPTEMATALARRGIVTPFPIQAAVLPDAFAGRDICGHAPTGSGKTLAYGIPLAAMVGKARPRHPRALVLVPTRELAAQVQRELAQLLAGRSRTVASFYGGVGFGPQLQALRRGVDVAVACPGRLADLCRGGDVELRDVDMVVIDEADRMADMGFLPEVRRLLDCVSPRRQTFLFSATLDRDVDVLVRNYQDHPVRHDFEPSPVDDSLVRHIFWRAERHERTALAADIVRGSGRALVFSRTRHGSDRIARQLGAAGITAGAIHGNLSQGQRDRALAAFASGRTQALVATDVAARGIHVEGVDAVIHYDLPGSAKDYVHRSGRTARAGATGLVVTLVGRDQARDLRRMQAELGLPDGMLSPDPAHLTSASVGRRERGERRPTPSANGRPSGPNGEVSGGRPRPPWKAGVADTPRGVDRSAGRRRVRGSQRRRAGR